MTAGRRPGPRRRLTDPDLVVLGILTSGPAHGHGMWNRLSECDVEDWAEVSRAQVYYSLGKLADQDLISPARDASAETRRERSTWHITPAGRRALTTALSSRHWAEQRRVPPFFTWVAWSSLVRPATRRRIIRERRAFLEAELVRERETIAEVRRLPANTPALAITISMVGQAIRQFVLELDWLDELDTVFAEADRSARRRR